MIQPFWRYISTSNSRCPSLLIPGWARLLLILWQISLLWQRLKVPVHQARHSPVCHVQPLAPWPTLATVSGQVVLSLTATHLVKLTGGVEGVHLHTLVTAPGGLALVGLGPAREGERQEAADWPPPLHRSYWHPTFTSHHSQAQRGSSTSASTLRSTALHCTAGPSHHNTDLDNDSVSSW